MYDIYRIICLIEYLIIFINEFFIEFTLSTNFLILNLTHDIEIKKSTKGKVNQFHFLKF